LKQFLNIITVVDFSSLIA